jgi:hypothetical protein
LLFRIETGCIDCQFAPHMVEQGADGALALIRRRSRQNRAPLPRSIISTEIVQVEIVDPQQTALFQVGLRHAP